MSQSLSPGFPARRDCVFFFTVPPPAAIYTLSLHDALPISTLSGAALRSRGRQAADPGRGQENLARPRHHDFSPSGSVRRSEEHTSELQSRFDLVCRLLLEKKNSP